MLSEKLGMHKKTKTHDVVLAKRIALGKLDRRLRDAYLYHVVQKRSRQRMFSAFACPTSLLGGDVNFSCLGHIGKGSDGGTPDK